MTSIVPAAAALCVVLMAACAADDAATPHQVVPCVPGPNSAIAPTYTELFDRYFAPETPGHCATAGCHADPGHNEWLCGTTKDSCYKGMVQVRLIEPDDLGHSMIADPVRSPLVWFSPGGNMPFDAPTPFPEGRDAIAAWVGACAQNN